MPHPAHPSSLVIVLTFGEEDTLSSRYSFTYVFLASFSESTLSRLIFASTTSDSVRRNFVSPSKTVVHDVQTDLPLLVHLGNE